MAGTICLALTLAFSLAALLLFAERSGRFLKYGRYAALLAFLSILGASGYLLFLFLTNRFDIAYVASYSSAELPLIYKVSAFWAGQQGSFLLWLLIHGTVSLCFCFRQKTDGTFLALYLFLQALLAILVLGKSPFAPQEVLVQDGAGLNPLLQDPWMAIHPPIIFIGYALLAVPLVYSMTALLHRDTEALWLERARKWALIAWAFLGAGIAIGGYWAYKVLGWGGFWGWDPVENSSLVPWLLTSIFIHVLAVARVRRAALPLVHLSAIFTFSLVLYGTFLTRSGILGDFSVHSFAGTSIGLTIAVVNAIVLLGGLVLLTMRAGSLPKGEVYPAHASREFFLLLGAMLLVFLSVLIFLGMSMPLLSQLVGKGAAVDTSFYVRTAMPLAIALMLVAAGALLYRYGKEARRESLKVPLVFLILGILAAFGVGIHEVLPLLLAGAALMAGGAALLSWRKRLLRVGGLVAHVGLSFSLFAMVLAGSGSQSVSEEFTVGEPKNILGHEIIYKGQEFAEDYSEKHYVYTVDGREVRALTKLRKSGEDAAREPAIDKTLTGDVYIAPVPPKDMGRTELLLKRGRTSFGDDYAYRFEGVAYEPLGAGKTRVTADVAVTDGERVEHATPTIEATTDGGTSQPVDVFGGARRLRLTGVSGDEQQIRLELLPSLAEEESQPINASVSTKPFIWVLWLGCLMVCGGTLLAVRR